ncbi:MAG TPA: DUF1592 domain-containing protein, partial [Polyangiaceae bacterium]|nr:DUF1592 domain-containing protein [Polyangiaceae bacterium]
MKFALILETQRWLRFASWLALVATSALAGCQGEIAAGNEGPGGEGTTERPPKNPDGTVPQNLDVNRVAIHRLNNAEYDNTLRDLLGISATPASSFIADEKLAGFDNIASAFGMTDAQYEQYFNAADALVEETFANASLRARILTCAPASSTDLECAKKIIAQFGLRAFRRPLEASEIERLTALFSDALELGEDFTGGVKHVIKTMLASVDFLYRIELDAEPHSAEPHLVGSYEMASRLSYLVWSTMPDSELLESAERGDLLKSEVLEAELGRLLSDPRASRFTMNFAGQWLGVRDLANHQVDKDVFAAWNEPLRQAMIREALAYFDEFLTGGRPITEFFTADVNFVDPTLAGLYGMAAPTSAAPVRVPDARDERRGFLGLASFLTLTSYSYRTAPTLRGKWVLENLLCQEQTPPPPNVPVLDSAMSDPAALQSQNVRERLEAHRANPECASCHKVLDPIGLGLEHFDGIGKFRTVY